MVDVVNGLVELGRLIIHAIQIENDKTEAQVARVPTNSMQQMSMH